MAHFNFVVSYLVLLLSVERLLDFAMAFQVRRGGVPLLSRTIKTVVTSKKSAITSSTLSTTFSTFTPPLVALRAVSDNDDDPATPGLSSSASVVVGASLSRQDASNVIDTVLFPNNQHSDRMKAGRNDQGIPAGSQISANDPRNKYTYGEFPLQSFDELVDMGLEFVDTTTTKLKTTTNLVDLGSGCGRLVMYAALSRGNSMTVQGIEIGRELHSIATEILDHGISQGFFQSKEEAGEGRSSAEISKSIIELHLGAAEDLTHVLGEANLVFAYSTVWPLGQDWNVELSAMVLGEEWSGLLSRSCRSGCVVITTDRALDPAFGWDLVDRRDVDNPEVFGSTGFVHVLRK